MPLTRVIEEESSTLLGSSSLGRRFALLSGRLRAQVTSIAGTDYEFAAGDSVCGVRQTDLVLDLSALRNLVLSFLQGAVVLASPQGAETPVDGNQRVASRIMPRR